MNVQTSAALATKLLNYYKAHNLTELESLFTENSELVTVPTGERSYGPDGARRDTQRWFTAIPDVSFDLQHLIAGEDGAVLELKCKGTNSGPLVTPEGTVPATGKKIEMSVCIVLRFENGKVASEHDYFDMASLANQLGIGQQQTAPQEEERPVV